MHKSKFGHIKYTLNKQMKERKKNDKLKELAVNETANFIFHQIYLVDPCIMARYDLVHPKYDNLLYKRMYKNKYNLDDDGLLERQKEAMKDVIDLKLRIRKELSQHSLLELKALYSNPKETDKFVSKFVHSKEEINNDSRYL